jgi:hypothetical protein
VSRLIPTAAAAPIDPASCLAAAEASGVDARDDAAFESLAPLLAALSADTGLLGRAAISVLKDGGDAMPAAWGAQVVMLAPPGERFVLRAGLWPGSADPMLADSGHDAFFYGVPHDHDFAFLTCGHLGPGYTSDEWEVDPATLAGLPGERVSLRSIGRHRLCPGEIRHYRAHRDIHRQHPPERFSVSLNLLARTPAHDWLGQYRYDTGQDRIAAALGHTPTELLFELSIRLGNGIDLAVEAGRQHRDRRTRIAAWRALTAAAPDRLPSLLSRDSVAADRVLSAHARAIAAELDVSAR